MGLHLDSRLVEQVPCGKVYRSVYPVVSFFGWKNSHSRWKNLKRVHMQGLFTLIPASSLLSMTVYVNSIRSKHLTGTLADHYSHRCKNLYWKKKVSNFISLDYWELIHPWSLHRPVKCQKTQEYYRDASLLDKYSSVTNLGALDWGIIWKFTLIFKTYLLFLLLNHCDRYSIVYSVYSNYGKSRFEFEE